MTVNVNIHEAKTHLSRLLEQVAAGERAGLQLLTADQVLLDLGRDFIFDASR